MHPPGFLFISIVAMIAVHFFLPGARLIATPWNALGAVALVFGAAWNVWADQLFKRAQTTVKPDQQPSMLVTKGPYRFSRHPMYLGMIVILVGVAVLLGSLTPFVIAGLFALLMAVRFVPAEEGAMKRAFGEAWGEYSRRVRKWL